MIRYEDQCVGCPTEMGCIGNSCPNANVRILVCDCCHEEVDRLYDLDGDELCADCVLDNLDVIE